MEKDIYILAMNLGSTSTKLALYKNQTEISKRTVAHSATDLERFKTTLDQKDFRKQEVIACLNEIGFKAEDLNVIVTRGGALPPLETGAYQINERMVYFIETRAWLDHPANAGIIMAYELGKELSIPSYIYDGFSVDQLQPLAKISGISESPRHGGGHVLNQRAMAIEYALSQNKKYEELTLIVAHLGGGISIGLHHKGRMIDILVDQEGAFGPERAGRIEAGYFMDIVYSGKYNEHEIRKMLHGRGGLVSHLGTNNSMEVEAMIAAGDQKAKLVYEAMAYQIAKNIGELATVVCGKADAIILTGGIAHSKMMTGWIKERVSFIAPVHCLPGENELEALAYGAYRVMIGEEDDREFTYER